MPLKSLMIISVIFCIALFGCSKKKGKDSAENIDSLETASLSSEESDDIFEEFYDEEGEKKEEEETAESSLEDFPTSSEAEFNPSGRYVVQVSCVLSKSLADNVASRLENKGYPAYIAEVENPTPELIGTYYRIRIGGFTGVSKARSFAENYLTRDGYEYWVDNRSNDNVGMGGYGLGESSSGSYEKAYTPEPEPATTAPSEDWSASEAPTPEKSKVTQPPTPEPVTEAPKEDLTATEEETTPTQESVEEPTTPSPETKTEVTPVQTETPTKEPEQPPAEKEDEWGETEEEWGSDTTGW